jgi:hypothetical protein
MIRKPLDQDRGSSCPGPLRRRDRCIPVLCVCPLVLDARQVGAAYLI